MVPALIRLRRGRPPRWSITADMPQRSTLHLSRRICRALIPKISAACTQLSCLLIALVITSRRVIARASRYTRRSMFCIQRPYRSQWTCLNVYAPDISNVYDTKRPRRLTDHKIEFSVLRRVSDTLTLVGRVARGS